VNTRALKKIRRLPGRWTLMTGLSLISVGVLSFNAYANFSATATDAQAITAGTMTLTPANENSATIAYSFAGTAVAPGDTMQRAIKLTVGGDVGASSIDITACATGAVCAGANALFDDATNAVTLKVESCSTFWDEAVSGGIPTYSTCDSGGTVTTVLASTSTKTLIASGSGHLTTGLNLSGANHLKLTFTLPSGADNSFQSLSDTLTLTFTANQRAATNK
jgi:spore coat-associated protein N